MSRKSCLLSISDARLPPKASKSFIYGFTIRFRKRNITSSSRSRSSSNWRGSRTVQNRLHASNRLTGDTHMNKLRRDYLLITWLGSNVSTRCHPGFRQWLHKGTLGQAWILLRQTKLPVTTGTIYTHRRTKVLRYRMHRRLKSTRIRASYLVISNAPNVSRFVGVFLRFHQPLSLSEGLCSKEKQSFTFGSASWV